MKTKQFKARTATPSLGVGVPALPPLDPMQRYALPEAAKYLRITRATIWAKSKRGEIALIHDGRRCFVPGAEIARLSQAPARDANS